MKKFVHALIYIRNFASRVQTRNWLEIQAEDCRMFVTFQNHLRSG